MSATVSPKSPTFTDTQGAFILRDGLPVVQTTDVLAYFHRTHSYSMEHATTYEGYSIYESDGTISGEAIARGYSVYLTTATRRGYGMDGYVVRTIEEFQHLVEGRNPDYTQDYVFEHVARAQLDAIEHALGYLSRPLEAIRGQLDTWVNLQRTQFGIEA